MAVTFGWQKVFGPVGLHSTGQVDEADFNLTLFIGQPGKIFPLLLNLGQQHADNPARLDDPRRPVWAFREFARYGW